MIARRMGRKGPGGKLVSMRRRMIIIIKEAQPSGRPLYRIKPPSPDAIQPIDLAQTVSLGRGSPGLRGVVVQVGASDHSDGVPAAELERRLLEIGFVEGARVEILHEGIIRRDPIAIRLDDMRVALRRREADAILIRPDIPAEAAE